MASAPYVVGQWVRGDRFYGRAALIRELLEGSRDSVWVLGRRRIGKTSLLRQIEHLTALAPERGYFPLFWSFEGASDPRELHLNFHDSLVDADRRLAEHGIQPADLDADDLFASLGQLRRRLRADGLKLLLLCDEIEELIHLGRQDASLLRKLRRALQAQDDMRSVLVSTIRLWVLADPRSDTSPFLSGFEPPLYLQNLSDEEARDLIRQANLPGDSRPRFDEGTIESVRERCDNHPYLIQLLCRSYLEAGSLDAAVEQVGADPMVGFFFGVDFDMLSDDERRLLQTIAERDGTTLESVDGGPSGDATRSSSMLVRLENLGYVRKTGPRRYVVANHFFRLWLQARASGEGQATTGPSGTSHVPTLMGDAPPAILDGRYELQERVGGGGMGVVYRAHDRLLRVPLAVKLIRPELTGSKDVVERLRREILLTRDIGHPNVLRIYHFGQSDGRTYLTMQWMAGQTLAEQLKPERALAIPRALVIATKLASALQAAHSHRVLHRDIKPSNVLFDDAGEPYLSDFGLARLLGDSGLTSHGTFLGTPDYASPEQAATLPLDERSDLYALGLVLFEMVTGRRPFRAGSSVEVLEMHRSATPPSPRTLNAAIGVELEGVILRCLDKSPSRRFPGCGDLRVALERLGG